MNNPHGGPRPAIRPDDKRRVAEPKERVTFRLSKAIIARLKGEKNQSKLIETLLTQYFERNEK